MIAANEKWIPRFLAAEKYLKLAKKLIFAAERRGHCPLFLLLG